MTRLFLLLLCSLGGGATYLLFLDGNEWVLLVALGVGALLWFLERLEVTYIGGSALRWNPLPGYLVPVVIISLAALVVCLPALKACFYDDDFVYIHLFHTPTLSQFLRSFRADLSQGLFAGSNLQEFRPLHGLSWMLSYSLWGLHPVGYHLSGILLLVLNALMVFLIARRLGPEESWRAGFAGLLFAVLPVHVMNVFWVNGIFVEGPPTLFYLSAFLYFVCYRSTGLTRYLALSVAAFIACLLSKETALVLPVTLVSYDLFRKLVGDSSLSAGDSPAGRKPWRRLVLPYAPFAALLLVYLAWRHVTFPSLLKEDVWAVIWSNTLGKGSPTGILDWLALLGRYFRTVQGGNLRSLLLPFPSAVLGLVLGLYLVWALFLLRRRAECRQSVRVIVYFGLVWYLIASAPLMATNQSPHHLYILSVGPCIATAFLVAPACTKLRTRAGYLRLLGAGLLVCICGCQLMKENSRRARVVDRNARARAELVAALEDMPKQALALVWFPRDSLVLPYTLQEPFTPTDLYSRVRIIESLMAYWGSLPQWQGKTKQVLAAELTGAPDERIEVNVLAWDEWSNSFQRKKCTLPRKQLGAYVTESLGGPLQTVDSIEPAEADKFVRALMLLVWQGS
jgi:hypothetical protein